MERPGDARTTGSLVLSRLDGPDRLPVPEAQRLTVHFPDFLPHFARQTLAAGGEIWVASTLGRLTGVMLLLGGERSATVFAQDLAVTEALLAGRGPLEVYTETPLGPESERFAVLEAQLPGRLRVHRFAHPVRAARAGDRPALLGLLHAAFGEVDERWFRPLPLPPERGFVVESDGRVVGAAWVAVVGARARLHSLAVHPRFRRLGIGRDLWQARFGWAASQGASSVLAEISDRNGPSRSLAEAEGMHETGAVYRTFRRD